MGAPITARGIHLRHVLTEVLEGEVVVAGATHGLQQRQVIGVLGLLLGQAGRLGQRDGDDRRALGVLDGLPQPQIDGDGQRRHQFRKTDLGRFQWAPRAPL
jgi:hypothetical protein